MAQIEIRNLTYTYPTASERPALCDVSLSVKAGEYITLCGKSGSGKTTLLRHLKTVLTPHGKRSGEVLFDGVKLENLSLREQASRIGYVMQDPDSQIVTDKVWHELAFGLENLGYDTPTIRLRVAEMAGYFGISDWFHRDVEDLSGGQKQLLNLASIMAMQPEVLILDEPTSQLDPIAASDFLNTVRKINRELGTTILITEHRLEDIFHASDRVLLLEEGKLLMDADPRTLGERLYKAQADLYTAMPAPVQVYYGVNAYLEMQEQKTGIETLKTAECPLTVREGRTWLSDLTAQLAEIKEDVSGTQSASAGEMEVPRMQKSLSLKDWEEKDLALEFKDVWFRYERNAPDVLRGMDLFVPKGSIYAIVGGNGTGKSTTLRAICRVVKPWKGKILVNGKKVETYKNGELFRQNVCMLPQDPRSLFVMKTVRAELEEMLLAGTKEEQEKKITEVIKICKIAHLMERHPYDLSGGEQQRTALAKVLLTEPKILLLDEPTKGMDNFYKQSFGALLKELQSRGTTIVMVSHDVEFCARYADLAAMCFDGGIVSYDTPDRLFGGNSFYTTAANRMSRHVFENTVTETAVIEAVKKKVSGV